MTTIDGAAGTALQVRLAQAGDWGDWQAFVDRSEAAGPMHHAGWYGVLRDAYRVKPAFLLASRPGSGLAGVLPMYRSRSPFTGTHYTSLEGGALANDRDAGLALLDAARQLRTERGVRYVQIRGCPEDAGAVPHLDTVHTIVPTSRGPDESWSAIKNKTRWAIRQAQKQPLAVTIDAEFAHLKDFHALYAAHMRELGTPTFGFETLLAMRRHLAPHLRLYMLSYRDAFIGGMLCVVHGKRWTDLYAIVRRPTDFEFANYLLYWHVIRDASENGVVEFDLGRSTAGSGVHLFKRKWGGYDATVTYAFHTAAERAGRQFGLLGETRRKGPVQRLWSKLPLPMCNVIGPLVRGDLPFL